MLGCSYTQWVEHLGELKQHDHIDHIIPIARYDLNDPIDVMRAFNWRNTQLLPSEQNQTKHASLPTNAHLLELKSVWPNAWWAAECDTWDWSY